MSAIFFSSLKAWLLTRNYDSTLKSKIKATYAKLVKSLNYYKINSLAQDNFKLKSILNLFRISFWIDMTIAALCAIINFFYTITFVYDFLGCQISTTESINWPWIGSLILHLLLLFFMVRTTLAAYKLSLRGNYHQQHLTLLFLDIMTLNILNILGDLFFLKNKTEILKINNDYKIEQNVFNTLEIKNYFKSIIKIEMFNLLIDLCIFTLFFIIGYFVENNFIKLMCWVFTSLSILLFYTWILPNFLGMIILLNLFKKLLDNNSYHCLLTIIRFLNFIFGYYYVAILINLLKLDENFKEIILENF